MTPKYTNIKIINAGENSEWSKKVQTALKEIRTPYVLLLLEDCFITDYVDNNKLAEAIKQIKQYDIKFYQILVQLINPKWEKISECRYSRKNRSIIYYAHSKAKRWSWQSDVPVCFCITAKKTYWGRS